MNVSGGGELEDDLEVLAAGQPVERDRTGEVSFAQPDVGSLINKERKGSSSRKSLNEVDTNLCGTLKHVLPMSV